MQTQSEPQNQPQPQDQPEARTRRCRHIHAAGHQCGSPCLRTEQFCYFHHTTRRPVSDPKTRRARVTTYDLPVPEDRDSIRAAIAQVMHDIANNHIDPRRAGLVLYSLQLALCALPKEPRMPAQPVSLHAAARPASRRRSRHNSSPVNHIPAEPFIEETILDEEHGLIAPETFLEPEIETEEEEDPGDEVLDDGRLLRNTLGYKLLKEVEFYEARRQGYEQAQERLLKEGKLCPEDTEPGIDIDIDAGASTATTPTTATIQPANCRPRPSLARHSANLRRTTCGPLTPPQPPETFNLPRPGRNRQSTRSRLICLQSASSTALSFHALEESRCRCGNHAPLSRRLQPSGRRLRDRRRPCSKSGPAARPS